MIFRAIKGQIIWERADSIGILFKKIVGKH